MEDNLDINNLIKAFSEKIGQMSTDLVVKDAYIQQLLKKIDSMSAHPQLKDEPNDEKKNSSK